ncbi:hypothetical protein LMTR3_26995 [Bradyrhizobium sp. LMTR 3]|nr:hypothetical protein LMTR3_26995 [Bradyrhizobium sp. LMTR 3]
MWWADYSAGDSFSLKDAPLIRPCSLRREQHPDVEDAVADAVGADHGQHQQQRNEQIVRDAQQAHPDTDHRNQRQQHDIADIGRGNLPQRLFLFLWGDHGECGRTSSMPFAMPARCGRASAEPVGAILPCVLTLALALKSG